MRDEWREEDKKQRLREVKESGSREDEQEGSLEEKMEEKNRDTFRTTSFTEMARRRKRNGSNSNSSCNCGHSLDIKPNPDSYYSTAHCNSNNSVPICNNNYEYTSMIEPPSPPPPPPPRPLPPCPPTLPLPPLQPPLTLCTVPANASRPERFDWLIAFSPDTETPPFGVEVSGQGSPHKFAMGSKVTTFKELRYRSRQNPQPPPVQPEPDPTVITPDPDFLYNLKWRREKADGDGTQWEYTSQAHSAFLQPQPTRSLTFIKEMLQVPDGGGLPDFGPPQRIGCSASDGNLWTAGGNREGKREKEEEGGVRGRADGGRNLESRTTAVRSVSFAGSVQKGGAWMANDVRGPLRGQELSSLCLQEKRALLSAVSVAVEAILAQFSSSRTLVQKAQSGDSSINPSLGRLVLQCLCPALRSLLSDGLKPHQSDLIAGRRPNSPWGLVQASTRPGPSTQALYNLQCRVAELPQLRQNRHRFNAFLLGLLNIKLLDYWLSHLQSCDDVLTTYYHPNSFMRLSHTSCQPLFDELLLLLQPLSLLTFNLDLLFQHHHLDPASPGLSPANHSPETPSPANQDCSVRISPRGISLGSRPTLDIVSEQDFRDLEPAEAAQKTTASPNRVVDSELDDQASHSPVPGMASASKGETSPQLQWVRETEILPPSVGSLSQQAGQVIQQGWGAVVRWGERLGQNWGNYHTSSAAGSEGDKPPPPPQDISSGSSSSTLIQPDLISHQSPCDSSPESSPTVPWGLGRLFGASRGQKNAQTRTPSARRPSHWLAPGVSVLSRIVSPTQNPVPEECRRDSPEQKETEETEDKGRPLRSVRTLCDHTGTGEELSFQKGEELEVLEGVDHDWVRCRRGDKEGLVPIGYTSLIM
ncbi:RUN and SH3 domain-containing protein 1-like [Megalops cyprinoides]|uniref:RUN and SH3 domain-containing protein 1-like n=1 Tax=Megalops cyprinoides TaxID=118141 RepID=UPI0018643F65|nr:RUN and SH3 domain-containing protein 1-like [Megalops cyprinoides]